MVLRAQRRIPFDQIVTRLEAQIMPLVQEFTEQLRHDFPELKITLDTKRISEGSGADEYVIQLECRLRNAPQARYSALGLLIGATLSDLTSYPRLNAFLGWFLDDNEYAGERPIELAYHPYLDEQEFFEDCVQILMIEDLPVMYKIFRSEIEKHSE